MSDSKIEGATSQPNKRILYAPLPTSKQFLISRQCNAQPPSSSSSLTITNQRAITNFKLSTANFIDPLSVCLSFNFSSVVANAGDRVSAHSIADIIDSIKISDGSGNELENIQWANIYANIMLEVSANEEWQRRCGRALIGSHADEIRDVTFGAADEVTEVVGQTTVAAHTALATANTYTDAAVNGALTDVEGKVNTAVRATFTDLMAKMKPSRHKDILTLLQFGGRGTDFTIPLSLFSGLCRQSVYLPMWLIPNGLQIDITWSPVASSLMNVGANNPITSYQVANLQLLYDSVQPSPALQESLNTFAAEGRLKLSYQTSFCQPHVIGTNGSSDIPISMAASDCVSVFAVMRPTTFGNQDDRFIFRPFTTSAAGVLSLGTAVTSTVPVCPGWYYKLGSQQLPQQMASSFSATYKYGLDCFGRWADLSLANLGFEEMIQRCFVMGVNLESDPACVSGHHYSGVSTNNGNNLVFHVQGLNTGGDAREAYVFLLFTRELRFGKGALTVHQ